MEVVGEGLEVTAVSAVPVIEIEFVSLAVVSENLDRGGEKCGISRDDQYYCQICLDVHAVSDGHTLNCGHTYCSECLFRYLSVKICDGVTQPKCFHPLTYGDHYIVESTNSSFSNEILSCRGDDEETVLTEQKLEHSPTKDESDNNEDKQDSAINEQSSSSSLPQNIIREKNSILTASSKGIELSEQSPNRRKTDETVEINATSPRKLSDAILEQSDPKQSSNSKLTYSSSKLAYSSSKEDPSPAYCQVIEQIRGIGVPSASGSENRIALHNGEGAYCLSCTTDPIVYADVDVQDTRNEDTDKTGIVTDGIERNDNNDRPHLNKINDNSANNSSIHLTRHVSSSSTTSSQPICDAIISSDEIRSIICEDNELSDKFEYFKFTKENLNARECPDCKHLQIGYPENPNMFCEKCHGQYCFFHSKAHPSSTCEEVRLVRTQEIEFNFLCYAIFIVTLSITTFLFNMLLYFISIFLY
jgi:Zinc finger, C3HC4 type (RING finger)